jgi:polyferredoxin
VYPQSIKGRFMTIRRWTFLGLHLLLLITPWIMVNGNPAFRVDLPARRVFLFGSIFTASDTIFLLLVLWFLAFSLFFFTAVFGRIWCGYACPQTVFLESWIRPIELWIEGDRLTRKRRDTKGWTFDRAWRKAAKWSVFLAVSVFLAMAGMSIFAGARELWTGQAGPVEYSLTAIFTFFWFWDFTWFREQFCSYVSRSVESPGRPGSRRRWTAAASTATSAWPCVRRGSTSGTGSSSSASSAPAASMRA